MGCAASSQGASDGSAGAGGAGAVALPKFRYGSANLDVFGVGTDKEKMTVRAVFAAGKSTVFLLTVPAKHEQVAPYATDAAAAQNDGENAGANNANEEVEGDTTGAAAPATAPAAAPAASMKGKTSPPVRWALYNDGKAEVKVICTFFHAENVKILDATACQEARMEGGRMQAELVAKGGQTVAFVEGPVGGYMWKCMVKKSDGGYDMGRPYEE